MFETAPKVILASGSAIRRQLLTNAGIRFHVDPADIDERGLAASLAGVPPPERAKALAEAKAADISIRNRDAIVIGADQMLELDGDVLLKANGAAEARTILLRLRGLPHHLHSGVALARNGEVIWSAVLSATLQVRRFSDQWLDDYTENATGALTSSVGAYELEGRGVQLFERIEGDYFTILGLPLLPLLAELRRLGAIEG